ncbi:MAG: BatD family protein [Bacteroidota bacterium]
MKRLFFLFIFLFNYYYTFAQNVVFSAEANANPVGIEDQIQVSFTIENVQELQGIQNPSFPGFKVLGGPFQSQSTNYSFNGSQQVRTSSISLSYVLQATKTGDLTIPPISAKDGQGKIYQSNSLTIKVVNGSLAKKRSQQQSADPFGGFDPFDDPFFGGSGGGGDPFAAIRQQQARMQQMLQQLQQQSQGMGTPQNLPQVSEKDLGKNIFIRVSVDKTKVNVGEQITATYKMYARIPMQAQLAKLPTLNGFWTQDFELPKDQKPQMETLDGIQYQTFTLKKSALFPQQTGTLILDAAEANGVARIADRSNPYGRDVQFKLKSQPVNITVTALPIKDQPENFGGAVGNFTLSNNIDKTNLSTDESLNLSIDISGTGNLKLIQAPQLSLPNGLDVFDPSIVDTITSRSTTISGHKIFTYTIAPRIAGDYEIPAIPFSFYNSKAGTYTTLFTKPFKIHVSQGKNTRKEISGDKLLSDIHGINNKAFTLQSVPGAFLYSWIYWSLYLVPLLLLLIFIWMKKRNESESSNISMFKNKYANKIALKRLKTAKAFLDKKETVAFYEEISKALWLYLSNKLNIPLSQLSKEAAVESLTLKHTPTVQLDKMNYIIEECALALYAPKGAAQQMPNIYSDTAQLISELEEILKK